MSEKSVAVTKAVEAVLQERGYKPTHFTNFGVAHETINIVGDQLTQKFTIVAGKSFFSSKFNVVVTADGNKEFADKSYKFDFKMQNDAEKIAQDMIDFVDTKPAPPEDEVFRI